MEKSIFQIPVKTINRMKFYKKSQYWSAGKLSSYQDEQLNKLIIHAGKNVPYYRNLFKEIGFNPESFKSREDLQKIPTLEKETVRTRKDEFIADNAAKFGMTNDSTSGSTGTPLHFILSDGVQANKIAALLRSYNWAGYRIGQKTFSLQSYYFPESEFKYNRFYNILRFDSNKLQKRSALKVISEINRFKPKFFMGFPFDILMLARFAREEGIEINSPQSIVTYGETLSDVKRKQLEFEFNCRVFNFYSLHECSAMIAECEAGNLHLIDDFAYHEIIEEDGINRLVGTSYYNYSMPLIRYEIRDNVELCDTSELCECGRHFRRIKEIIGKECDYIQTLDGRFLGAVMSHSIDNADGVICSQCVQHSLDEVDINLITDSRFTSNSQQKLEKDLRKRLGTRMKLKFNIVNELEKRPGGKTPFILSRIGNEYI